MPVAHWSAHNTAHRREQVALTVETAQHKVRRIQEKVAARGASLDAHSMPVVAMALEILHQGRGGRTTYDRIAAALNEDDCMATLMQIGGESYASRVATVAGRAKELLGQGEYGGLRYDAVANAFA